MYLSPIFTAKEVIIPYGIHPFDICLENPELWYYIKITYVITFFISNIIISHFIYVHIVQKFIDFLNKFRQFDFSSIFSKNINHTTTSVLSDSSLDQSF